MRFLTGLESLRSPFEALMIFFTTVHYLAAGNGQILVRDARF